MFVTAILDSFLFFRWPDLYFKVKKILPAEEKEQSVGYLADTQNTSLFLVSHQGCIKDPIVIFMTFQNLLQKTVIASNLKGFGRGLGKYVEVRAISAYASGECMYLAPPARECETVALISCWKDFHR